MSIKEQVSRQIKKYFVTQGKFCSDELGIAPTNYPKVEKVYDNKIKWLNAFLAPLHGRIEIIWDDEKKDSK